MTGGGEPAAKTSPSGIPIDPVYRPPDPPLDYPAALGDPGVFPFTRGVRPDMYRGRLWTMRQYAGFATARETNERFRHLLAAGQTGLSVAFDLPTQMGLDSDSPRAAGEVGRAGVAIDTVEDMHQLFDQIDLGAVSTSMTINATASTLLAMYTEPSLRLVADVFRFCAAELPSWNPISISGYHIREAGATAIQELAFTLANTIEYVSRAIDAGLAVDDFAPRLSFFFAAHNDLFEEIAKFRAARRLYARIMRERFSASDQSCRMRFHTQTGGVTLTAQQPLNNVVRVAVQALAATLGGTQSLHTNGYDEALALPTAEAATLALRTQQIIAYESGIANTADPLAGSYYVESLTDEIETRALELIAHSDELGGAEAAIAEGFFQEEIGRSAYEHQLRVESGATIVVGVNRFTDDSPEPDIPAPDYTGLEAAQIASLSVVRERRDNAAVQGTLEALGGAAAGLIDDVGSRSRMIEPIIDAVRARATVGEIAEVLRTRWDIYVPQTR